MKIFRYIAVLLLLTCATVTLSVGTGQQCSEYELVIKKECGTREQQNAAGVFFGEQMDRLSEQSQPTNCMTQKEINSEEIIDE